MARLLPHALAAPDDLDASWRGLFDAPALVDDLVETLPLLRERIARPSIPLPDAEVPLRLRATYGRDEILAAFGRWCRACHAPDLARPAG